jgi:hypothetical protein
MHFPFCCLFQVTSPESVKLPTELTSMSFQATYFRISETAHWIDIHVISSNLLHNQWNCPLNWHPRHFKQLTSQSVKLQTELTPKLFQVTSLISESVHWIDTHVISRNFFRISKTAHWIYSHVYSSIQILATDRLAKQENHIITFNTTHTTSQHSPILPSKSCNKLQHKRAHLHCRNSVGTMLLATSDRIINNQFKTQNIFWYRGTWWRLTESLNFFPASSSS